MRARLMVMVTLIAGSVSPAAAGAQGWNVDSLYSAIRAAAARSSQPGLVYLRAGRDLLAEGHLEGMDPWYHGAVFNDTVSLSEYARDLSPIWTPDEERIFWNAQGEDRVSFLHRFWKIRESPLHRAGERAAEHYRRIGYALAHYPRPEEKRTYEHWEKVRTPPALFDDRGLIYVRHGPPARRYASANARLEGEPSSGIDPTEVVVNTPGSPPLPTAGEVRVRGSEDAVIGPFLPPVETWWYEGQQPFQVFFRACAAYRSANRFERQVCGPKDRDFRLLQNGLEVFAPMPSILPATRNELGSRRRIDGGGARYPALDEVRAVATGQVHLISETNVAGNEFHRRARAIQQGEEWVERGLGSETFAFNFPNRAGGRAEVVAIGVDNGVTMAHVAYAVKAEDLVGREGEDRFTRFPVTVRILLRSEDGTIVGRKVVRRAVSLPRPLGGRFVQGVESIPVLSAVRTAEVVVEENVEHGMHVVFSDLRTPALEDPRPALSDLVVGSKRWGLHWNAGADTVWFSPSARFHPLEPMEVAFEVYGIPAGNAFRSEIQVVKKRGGLVGLVGGDDVRFTLGFSEVSSGPLHRVRRTLNVERLEEGDYLVIVALEGPDGELLRRETEVHIHNP